MAIRLKALSGGLRKEKKGAQDEPAETPEPPEEHTPIVAPGVCSRLVLAAAVVAPLGFPAWVYGVLLVLLVISPTVWPATVHRFGRDPAWRKLGSSETLPPRAKRTGPRGAGHLHHRVPGPSFTSFSHRAPGACVPS